MKLIDKATLVAEIEKVEDAPAPSHDQQCDWEDGYACGLCKAVSIIDTIKVKEMDLEKLINEYFTGWYFDSELDILAKPNNYSATINDIKEIAKYFFELGVRVNNPITAADRGTAEEIIINLKRVEQDYKINLTKEMEWLRNKVKKGE